MSEPNAPNYWKSRADAVEVENVTLRRRLEELNQLLIQEYEKSNGRRDRLKQTEARLDALRSWLTRVFCEDLRRMMVWKASGHKPS